MRKKCKFSYERLFFYFERLLSHVKERSHVTRHTFCQRLPESRWRGNAVDMTKPSCRYYPKKKQAVAFPTHCGRRSPQCRRRPPRPGTQGCCRPSPPTPWCVPSARPIRRRARLRPGRGTDSSCFLAPACFIRSASPTSSPRRSAAMRPSSSAPPAERPSLGASRSGGTAMARSWAVGGQGSRPRAASPRGGSSSSATAATACSPSRDSTPTAASSGSTARGRHHHQQQVKRRWIPHAIFSQVVNVEVVVSVKFPVMS